ncbi:MAG: GIY-YIG nuclease family protein [Exiguobacterium sp.]|nr:GIY-YIG nuclease family protein [Exiguobacterium sp.]
MSDSYSVYVHVNKFNNKKYVGITSAPVEKRWRNGLGYKRNNYFWRAISKYGWDGFDHYVLFSGLDKSVAADIEKK